MPGELGFCPGGKRGAQRARYDVFKLSEAVLAGQAARVQRMLDGLQAEGEAEVLVHYTLAEDIRALKRVKDSMAAGAPLPMALREQRIWGVKELFERVLPRITPRWRWTTCRTAHLVDGIVKGPQPGLARRRLAGAAPAGPGAVSRMPRRSRRRPPVSG